MEHITARIVEGLRRLLSPASARHRSLGVPTPMRSVDTPTLTLPRILAVPIVDYDPAPPYVDAYLRTCEGTR